MIFNNRSWYTVRIQNDLSPQILRIHTQKINQYYIGIREWRKSRLCIPQLDNNYKLKVKITAEFAFCRYLRKATQPNSLLESTCFNYMATEPTPHHCHWDLIFVLSFVLL